MSHLDEGTLHALLDGELDLHEVKEIQAHIGSCAACGTRLREVKEFHGESDRLVAVLEAPAASPRRAFAADAESDSVSRQASRTAAPRPLRNLPRISGPAAEPPPLLMPENSEYGRGRFMRRMRWVALAFVTVGAGYVGSQMRKPSPFASDGLPFPALTPTDTALGAVLSSEESAPAVETDTAVPVEAKREEPAVPRRAAPRAPVVAKATEAAPEAGAGASVTNAADFEDSLDEAGEDAAAPESPAGVQRADVRSEAARALRELDRERQMDRAAAATAALDSARRREALARQTAAAPAPRTPEQRAQTYLRIGLDEAAKQLGRPVHVIEGMSPLFMGLTQGRVSPGADAARPVVRVVYQDAQGRLIFLDQQRLRPGQTGEEGGARWTRGDISLHLSGEVGADVLRNLRPRVR